MKVEKALADETKGEIVEDIVPNRNPPPGPSESAQRAPEVSNGESCDGPSSPVLPSTSDGVTGSGEGEALLALTVELNASKK